MGESFVEIEGDSAQGIMFGSSNSFIDSWVWKVRHEQAAKLLSRYLRGQLTYRQFKIKLFYLKKEAMAANQVRLEL